MLQMISQKRENSNLLSPTQRMKSPAGDKIKGPRREVTRRHSSVHAHESKEQKMFKENQAKRLKEEYKKV